MLEGFGVGGLRETCDWSAGKLSLSGKENEKGTQKMRFVKIKKKGSGEWRVKRSKYMSGVLMW